MPRTVSLQNAAGREFARNDKKCGDFSFSGMYRPGVNASDYHVTDVSAETYPDSLLDSEHVLVSLHIAETLQNAVFTREYIIYPAFPAIAVRNSVCVTVMPNLYWSRRLSDSANATCFPVEHLESCADSITPAMRVAPTLAIEFCARTDCTDELVKTHKADDGQLNGNLLFWNMAISSWNPLRLPRGGPGLSSG